MRTYVSTFISGLLDPVTSLLKQSINDVEILSAFDGLIIYKTNKIVDEIKQLKFFNNSFSLLEKYDDLASEKDPLNVMLRQANKNEEISVLTQEYFKGNKKTFRIITSHENQLVAVSPKLKLSLELKILKNKKATLDRSEPDIEFWFLYRSEGVGLFMVRLTDNVTNKQLNKGELRPELAHILCYLAEPTNENILLDPFAGYGAIPLAGVKNFSFKQVNAIDNDDNKLEYIKSKISKKLLGRLLVKKQDALTLEAFDDASVTKVVTDPPWGIYGNQPIDVTKFYPLMLLEFYRVLKKSGLAIVLIGKKNEFETALNTLGTKFSLEAKYDILVSGKKASVYKLKKK